MQPVGIEHGHSSVLSRISTDLSKNATKLHQLDLERVSERTEAKRQLQVTLGDLKNRVARRAAARARSTSVNGAVELAYIAS
jgi:hypothetical protein